MEPKYLKPGWMNWAGSIILSILLVVIGLVVLIAGNPGTGITLIILGIIIILMVVVKRATWTYVYNDMYVETRKGIISKKTSQIDLKDVKNIQFKQSIFERIFGLGTVAFASAATGSIEVAFAGIPDAQKVKQEIDGLIHSVKSGTAGTKKCPQCAELVKNEAIKCRYCGYEFEQQ
ncbi:MAG TPA: hypothetical protein ENN07_02335 [candidate division Zixibacteria bacterium]|nr:hypothetical protein [candidate division Zixibacteria bacterium]